MTYLKCACFFATCTVSLHSLVAQDLRRVGGFTQFADAYIPRGEGPSSVYRPACQFPFRSVAGQRFENLTPLFAWLTNDTAKPGPRPLTNWAVVRGEVISIKYERGIIVQRAVLMTPGYSDVFHLLNYPGEASLIDGADIFGIAKHVGTIQYRTVSGTTATVHSFDFGRPPTPEEIAAVRAHAPVMTNTLATNHTITIKPRQP